MKILDILKSYQPKSRFNPMRILVIIVVNGLQGAFLGLILVAAIGIFSGLNVPSLKTIGMCVAGGFVFGAIVLGSRDF